MKDRGINALPYHAGMDHFDRQTHQNAFKTDPGVVIVATIAFGMGIDKSTYGSSSMSICREASKPITKRSAAQDATVHPPTRT